MISTNTIPNQNKSINRDIAFEPAEIKDKLLNLAAPCYVVKQQGKVGLTNQDWWHAEPDIELLMAAPALSIAQLGDRNFLDFHKVKYAYMTGAMAGGIASEELVIALGKQGILASFGAGGLSLDRVEKAIARIQQALPNGTYAFNLLHSPNEPEIERNAVELYLKYGVHTL